MLDSQGRTIDHLRLSLTDRCNLACRYCAPATNSRHNSMIDPDFALQVVRWLTARHGIRHVRLTGGEPLLYPGLPPLITNLSRLDGLHEVTLTTNAQALAHQAIALRNAGLTRINISLDTLDPDRFAELTRGGAVGRTLAGIDAAISAGFAPVKINVIAQRGINDTELPDIAEWALARGCTVRFLEVMPIGPLAHVAHRYLVPADEILELLGERFELRPIAHTPGQPSCDYVADGAGLSGVIGIIAPTTRPFCETCCRLRVTARGLLVACLHANAHYNLAECWNGRNLDTDAANRLLHQAMTSKPTQGLPSQSLTMLALGG